MNRTPTLLDKRERVAGDEARRLATVVYERLLEDVRALTDDEWNAPTVCEPWTVADMVRHLVGAAKGHASVVETARQVFLANRRKDRFDGNSLDAMNALQVDDHRALDPDALLQELEAVAPRAVAKRMSTPGFIRRREMALDQGGSTAVGMPTGILMGDLMDVVLTRDVWLHRIDIADATGRRTRLDEDDRRIIEDVATEWGARHGRGVVLHLTGDAGGWYALGKGGRLLQLDAVQFCRILSGRGAPPL